MFGIFEVMLTTIDKADAKIKKMPIMFKVLQRKNAFFNVILHKRRKHDMGNAYGGDFYGVARFTSLCHKDSIFFQPSG